jgi:hypothetical protein
MKKKQESFVKLFVIVYNVLALITVLGLFPKDIFYWENNDLIIFITFPISLISFGYRYGQSEPIYPVFIIQAVMFAISWILLITLPNRKGRK